MICTLGKTLALGENPGIPPGTNERSVGQRSKAAPQGIGLWNVVSGHAVGRG